MRVREVMTTDVAAARPETSLKEAAREMAARGISGMPVVDDDGRVVGVISEADLLGKERQEPESGNGVVGRLRHRPDPEAERRFEARDVGGAMTAPAITVESHCPVTAAAERMLAARINRLPVVQRGRLVGIVTRADLVRAFARSDEELATEIREIIALQQELWRDDGALDVGIDGGEVQLRGRVRRRAEAEVLPKLIRTVPGVVGVRSELVWAEDD
jgi:CBS domain-containing protein